MIYEMFSAHNAGSEITSEICCVSIQTILITQRERERDLCFSECQLKNQVPDLNLAIHSVILKFNITTY